MENVYQSPLTSRYASPELSKLFSEKHKIVTWRTLWVYLAQAEMELGLTRIKPEHLNEMRAHLEDIDWAFNREHEKKTRHDVMSHVHTFEKVCPKVKEAGIVHLGATSAYVQDNADLIAIRDGLDWILKKTATVLQRLGDFCEKYKSLPTVGRTHYQAATMTTVGKRGAIWAQDILLPFERLEYERKHLQFRGIQGATGTQASFLTLFDGDAAKVKKLNARVTELAGFTPSNNCSGHFIITGQTYTRQQDALIINAIAVLASGVHKICMDLRMLQLAGELAEPFGENQIGSSAMPYKRNPMRAERCCSFARYLMNLVGNTLDTASIQGFERTLDDSANRRLVLPEAFITADIMLNTLQNIFEQIQVIEPEIRRNIAPELPFLTLETLLMEVTKGGESRQDVHEKIRELAMKAHELRKQDKPVNLLKLIEEMGDDVFWKKMGVSSDDKTKKLDYFRKLLAESDPQKLIGLCPEQVQEFLTVKLRPAIKNYAILTEKAELKV